MRSPDSVCNLCVIVASGSFSAAGRVNQDSEEKYVLVGRFDGSGIPARLRGRAMWTHGARL